MKTLITAAVAGLAIALAACTKEDARDVGNDVEAAADKVATETKEAVNSPEMKEVGSEIKEAASDVGTVLKGAAKGAAEGGREAAAKVEGEAKDETHDTHTAADDAKKQAPLRRLRLLLHLLDRLLALQAGEMVDKEDA